MGNALCGGCEKSSKRDCQQGKATANGPAFRSDTHRSSQRIGRVADAQKQQVGDARQSRERADALGDAQQPRLEGHDGNGANRNQPRWEHAQPCGPARPTSFWSDHELVWCDERELGRGWVPRRTEPGVFPLADGVPQRVGKLRAYGNAIVPQVAAEFIRAYMEVRGG